nr:MAG TPA: hypothetical protein [Caudoviricetes sp.]
MCKTSKITLVTFVTSQSADIKFQTIDTLSQLIEIARF